ncbi:molybdopterin-guanine dinucleotide biosynthesis protein B [Paenibacillus humicola]|uniref:molybdopterin-guanine dinucleotide biosynthesis protein B n=1 Tax=Paenibacillus humicola TaxID=3110540 RepID=UPI00237B476E|nr:molybdopterin-guanine dinucleotide biosynthesis protein B [Paenibacillus humicola]
MIPPTPRRPVVLQIAGYKNSGKTTLIAALVRLLKQSGLTVGTVKHDAHDFAIDTPGTDTWRHREAGADITAISSSRSSAIMRGAPESLDGLLAHMRGVDVVLVEGFKLEPYPKLVLIRRPEDAALANELKAVIAAAVWPEAAAALSRTLPDESSFPVFAIGDTEAIGAFVMHRVFR